MSFWKRASPYWNSFSKFVSEKTKLVQEKVEPAISDPKTNLWDPIKQFVQTQTQVAQERTITVQQDPKQAAFLLFNPTRFLKIGIAAWIVAEVLHGIGFFDNPEGVGPKLKELYKEHLDEGVSQVRYRVLDWWEDERSHGGWLNIHTYSINHYFRHKSSKHATTLSICAGRCNGHVAFASGVDPCLQGCQILCNHVHLFRIE